MSAEHISMDNIEKQITKMERESKLAYESFEKLESNLRRTRNQLRKETDELGGLKRTVWNSKDQGVIDLRNEILALSLAEIRKKSDQKECNFSVSFEIDDTKYEIPNSIDELRDFGKVFTKLISAGLIKRYSTDYYFIHNIMSYLRFDGANIKRNVWRSKDPDIIELRELLLVTMKLSN